jgi:hypothetical protein
MLKGIHVSRVTDDSGAKEQAKKINDLFPLLSE